MQVLRHHKGGLSGQDGGGITGGGDDGGFLGLGPDPADQPLGGGRSQHQEQQEPPGSFILNIYKREKQGPILVINDEGHHCHRGDPDKKNALPQNIQWFEGIQQIRDTALLRNYEGQGKDQIRDAPPHHHRSQQDGRRGGRER